MKKNVISRIALALLALTVFQRSAEAVPLTSARPFFFPDTSFFDYADCNIVAGWACSLYGSGGPPLYYDVYVDGQFRIRVAPNAGRPDVPCGVGFNINVSQFTSDGQQHNLSVVSRYTLDKNNSNGAWWVGQFTNGTNRVVGPCAAPTPIPTSTPYPTSTPIPTSTWTPIPTLTATPTSTFTSVPTFTPTFTPTPTRTATTPPTLTHTAIPSSTPTNTPYSTMTPKQTKTPVPTVTATPTATYPGKKTRTPTPTSTASPTCTVEPGKTPTVAPSPTPTPAITFTPAPSVIRVKPIVECIDVRHGKGFVARFGYFSENSDSVRIRLGNENFVSPPPIDRGQPMTFFPGRVLNVFSVTSYDGSSVSWTLGTEVARATSLTPHCKKNHDDDDDCVGHDTSDTCEEIKSVCEDQKDLLVKAAQALKRYGSNRPQYVRKSKHFADRARSLEAEQKKVVNSQIPHTQKSCPTVEACTETDYSYEIKSLDTNSEGFLMLAEEVIAELKKAAPQSSNGVTRALKRKVTKLHLRSKALTSDLPRFSSTCE